ncbi:MAG: phage holin family protein [Patescibacteria group bacterium]|jgi:putative membrane protein
MKLLLRWFINALALLALTQILRGFQVDSFTWALIAALVIGLLNAVIRPILVVLTLPVTILTLGLFTFVINAGLLWFASYILEGFRIADFWTALAAAIVLWAVSFLTNKLIGATEKE